MKENKEKVFVTRNEEDCIIWLWRKPKQGNFSPEKMKDCDSVVWIRPESMNELDTHHAYLAEDFKKKFGFIIKEKVKKSVQIDKKLLDSEDYKLFSFDPNRKK